jgi:predicted transcriptional regulator
MVRTHVFLPEPLVARLKELAEQRDVSVAELIRLAITEYLKRQK